MHGTGPGGLENSLCAVYVQTIYREEPRRAQEMDNVGFDRTSGDGWGVSI
jgi:hypothetical protein